MPLTELHPRQSLLDVAIATCGAFEAAYALAARGGFALTDTPPPGTRIECRATDILRPATVRRMAARRIRPATAVTPEEEALAPWGGIGYMAIETDFIIQ